MTSIQRSPRKPVGARLALAMLASGGALLLGSCRTPQSLCDEWLNEMAETGITLGVPFDDVEPERFFGPIDPMNPTRRGCGIVSTVSDTNEIVNECFPILREIRATYPDLDSAYQPFVVDFPDNLPDSCSVGHFEIIR